MKIIPYRKAYCHIQNCEATIFNQYENMGLRLYNGVYDVNDVDDRNKWTIFSDNNITFYEDQDGSV